jgi:hypothetical protein
MTDYLKALNAGLLAADQLEKQKEEIQNVLLEVDKQVRGATNGIISCKVNTFESYPESALLRLASLSVGTDKYEAIAFNSKVGEKSQHSELAKWATKNGGYPVKLTYSSEVSCHDQKSLEMGIQELLSRPSTGQKLRALLANAGISELVSTKVVRPREV